MQQFIGRLLGLDDVRDVESFGVSLAASWAQDGAFWVFLGAVAAFVGSLIFYAKYQSFGRPSRRTVLGIVRGLILAMLLITLADPVLRITLTHRQPPFLYLLFDGTDSMAIEDEYTEDQRKQFDTAVGATESENAPKSRLDYVRRLISKSDDNLLEKLRKDKSVQLAAFLFEGNTTSKLRKLQLSSAGDEKFDPDHLAEQLDSKGQVTALGAALGDAANQLSQGKPAGVVVFSDFAQNSGPSPLGDRTHSPAARLGAPIYTVGFGAAEAVDLAVDLQTDPKMKKAERSTIVVKLRQSGLDSRSVQVTVTGRRLSGETGEIGSGGELSLGSKLVTLDTAVNTAEFPFTPQEAGRFEFTAEVEKIEGEIVEQNNRASREVNIIDDYLRLLYVANEPNWEWRFVKEVFHRDKLVGMDGFRTYLASSDPRVRESNVLFLPTLTPKRNEFFANDVIFLADMPKQGLNDRFCDMVKEYVGNLGGGLVVISGPQFGVKDLQGTALADMLPVIVDPQAEVRAAPKYPDFRLRLTPHAGRYSFMRLAASEAENTKAWDNLGPLPWYQPVAALHEQAFALAEYPSTPGDSLHVCRDGKTPQPIIAIRQYGKGEVVYLAFNEMWRLRRRYGEKYYREFWSQLIYRLGMSHALGNDKRFVVRLDQQQYRAEDKAVLTVEAYDENYEPFTEDNLAGRTLQAELTVPDAGSGATETRSITVPLLRPGAFEARIPVFAAGEYGLRVKDPVDGKFEELRFEVTGLSAERRRGVRDETLQKDLARETRGKSYDLTTVANLVHDLEATPKIERQTRNFPLWATPWWFGTIVALMLCEWLARKLMKLP